MSIGLTVTRQDLSIFTRSDGEVFHLVYRKDGGASLFHVDRPPPDGTDLDVSIEDKPAWAEKLILAYQTNWSDAFDAVTGQRRPAA
jgi:hypothetical protein